MEEKFVPKIVGFVCSWCSSAGADVAGSAQLNVPSSFIPISVMCSSRVDPALILAAFLRGADGVLVAGCRPRDCHYENGNYYARRRFALVKNIIKSLGLEPERLRLSWIHGSEGQKFADVVTQFAEDVKGLGPNPARKKIDL